MNLPKERWSKGLLSIRPVVESVYYKGNLDLLLNDSPKLAIVGSRRITDYGVRVIEKWMPELVGRGITIVSGFMYGVDQVAHKACLDNEGKTIAVLGYGIDRKIGGDDLDLYRNVIDTDSLIVSEYEGEHPADRWTFPARNRIVAGISDAVLVVEAALGSGSLITARLATRFGKPLLSVPGQLTSKVAEGTNELIRSGKGKIVTSPDDILNALGLQRGQLKLKMDNCVDPLLILLADADRSVDEIAGLLKFTIPQVLGKLTTLSLKGLVCERNGKVGLV